MASLPIRDFSSNPEYKRDMKFFVEVYKTMQEHYYKPLDEDQLKKFVYLFNTRLYPEMKATGKSSRYIKWRNAAYLVQGLKEKDDIFSAFFPPKYAKRYEKTVLGERVDLGIDGKMADNGYLVTWVEPRSDAFTKGLRENDVIYRIDKAKVTELTKKKVKKLLVPLLGTKVLLSYYEQGTSRKRKIRVVSKEYYKQLAFMVPTGVKSVFCIRIDHFNRMTGADVKKFMNKILNYPGKTSLIIDLRGNPGGPPLAARAISAFFLPSGSPFAYFTRRHPPPAVLDVPVIPNKEHYKGDMVILINKKTGSASELFSGVLQGKGRAELMGVNSAGQVFLKSMFYLSDGSMLLVVTARGHRSDGSVFSFSGLNPDVRVKDPKVHLVHYAAEYLMKKRKQEAAANKK